MIAYYDLDSDKLNTVVVVCLSTGLVVVQLLNHNSVHYAWEDLVLGMSCWQLLEWYNTLESVHRGTAVA